MTLRSLPSTTARRYWSAVTIASLVLLALLLLDDGGRRATAGLVLSGVAWTGGLLGQWAVRALAGTTPPSRLARASAASFALLPAVGVIMLVGGLWGNPLLDIAYLVLWVVGFVSFALLLVLMITNLKD